MTQQRELTRYERNTGDRIDPDRAIQDLRDAYRINGKQPPPHHYWCPYCVADFAHQDVLTIHAEVCVMGSTA